MKNRPDRFLALPRAHLQRNGAAWSIEVRCAFSWMARARGLLGVKAPAAGLWLRPCAAVHTLGMAGPIDLVFLGRDGLVRKVMCALKPGRCAAAWGAHSVLELPAGTVARAGIRPGDRIHATSITGLKS